MILATALAAFLSWGGAQPSGPVAAPSATPGVAAMSGIIGAGGRLSWEADPRDEPAVRLDAQMVVRPIPRVLVTGAWGRSERSRGGGGAPESTTVSNRWELGAAFVIAQAHGSGYIPVLWRSTHERDDRLGDASWNSWGFGVGGLFPVSAPVWFRAEGLWMIEDRHEEPSRGSGRETDRSGMELGLGFLVFLR
jgi:hypothetical protein